MVGDTLVGAIRLIDNHAARYHPTVLEDTLPIKRQRRMAVLHRAASMPIENTMLSSLPFSTRVGKDVFCSNADITEMMRKMGYIHNAHFDKRIGGWDETPIGLFIASRDGNKDDFTALSMMSDFDCFDAPAYAYVAPLLFVLSLAETHVVNKHIKPILPLLASMTLAQLPCCTVWKNGELECLDPVANEADFLFLAMTMVQMATVILYSPGRITTDRRDRLGQLMFPHHDLSSYYDEFHEQEGGLDA